MAPETLDEFSGDGSIFLDSAENGEANLAGVSVSAEKQMDAGGGGLRIQLGIVREQDFKALAGHCTERFREIGAAVIELVVQTGEPQRCAVSLDRYGVIDKHADAEFFEAENHFSGVVIAENGHNAVARVNGVEDGLHARIHIAAGAGDFVAVIAGENTQVGTEVFERSTEGFGEAVDLVDVEVREMQDFEAIEGRREVRQKNGNAADDRAEGVAETAAVKPSALEGELQDGRFDAAIEPEPEAAFAERAAGAAEVLLDFKPRGEPIEQILPVDGGEFGGIAEGHSLDLREGLGRSPLCQRTAWAFSAILENGRTEAR